MIQPLAPTTLLFVTVPRQAASGTLEDLSGSVRAMELPSKSRNISMIFKLAFRFTGLAPSMTNATETTLGGHSAGAIGLILQEKCLYMEREMPGRYR